jgi:cystathionine beta-lyase/cystathionine gamma-synthase
MLPHPYPNRKSGSVPHQSPRYHNHASIPKEEWEALEITDSLLRLSVCIEKANDIDQALKKI